MRQSFKVGATQDLPSAIRLHNQLLTLESGADKQKKKKRTGYQ